MQYNHQQIVKSQIQFNFLNNPIVKQIIYIYDCQAWSYISNKYLACVLKVI